MWSIIGAFAALCTMSAFFPQIIKVLRTRSVNDVSLATLVQLAVGVSLWIVYGIHLNDVIIIGANVVTLTSVLVLLMLYYRYRRVS